MYQSPKELRDERRRRQLYLFFAFALIVAAVVCGVLGFLMLTPRTPLVRLGPTSKFGSAGDQPVDVAVQELEISHLIPNRPALSDDVIFVVRDGADFRAFLGIDPSSGCFLSWRAAEQIFRDSCNQHSYGFTGRNNDQLTTTTTRPVNMVELPVTVRADGLFVEDRILRRDLR
jgi:hypothetical protein